MRGTYSLQIPIRPTASTGTLDQVFIDQWEQTIAMYENIFAGVTLCLSPDARRVTSYPSTYAA